MRIAELEEFMRCRLRAERRPALVRKPALDFQNRTVLDVIGDEGVDAVYDYVRRRAAGYN